MVLATVLGGAIPAAGIPAKVWPDDSGANGLATARVVEESVEGDRLRAIVEVKNVTGASEYFIRGIWLNVYGGTQTGCQVRPYTADGLHGWGLIGALPPGRAAWYEVEYPKTGRASFIVDATTGHQPHAAMGMILDVVWQLLSGVGGYWFDGKRFDAILTGLNTLTQTVPETYDFFDALSRGNGYDATRRLINIVHMHSGKLVRFWLDIGANISATQVLNAVKGWSAVKAIWTILQENGVTMATCVFGQPAGYVAFEAAGIRPTPKVYAHATASARSGPAPLRIRFSGDGSTSRGCSISAYHWSFGDGASASGAEAVHRYAIPGKYTATLRVTGSTGAVGSSSVTVSVGDQIQGPVLLGPDGPHVGASVWTQAHGLYVVDERYNGFTIHGDLTIQPGVTVKFTNGTGLTVEGRCTAVGSPEAPIVFTSIRDDTVEGDTNGDGNASVPRVADWGGISLGGSGRKIMAYCQISYAGGLGLMANGGDHVVRNSTITKCASGLYMYGTSSSVAVRDNTITHNRGTGIHANGATDMKYVIVGNRVSSNTADLKGSDHGGIWCLGRACTVENNTVTNNKAYLSEDDSCGIYCAAETVAVSHNTVRGNGSGYPDATEIYAIYCRSNKTSIISNNVVSGNTDNVAGGIYCWGPSTIKDNIVSGNSGSGIHAITAIVYPSDATATIRGNVVTGNGGGISCRTLVGGLISGNIISRNTESWGIYAYGPMTIESNTVDGNFAGVSLTDEAMLINNIITFSTGGPGVEALYSQTPVRYCDVYGNSGGNYKYDNRTGISANISKNPLFADRARGDFHLKSAGGRWNGSAWTEDGATSPCVDAGDPASPFGREPQPNGGRINMGAYGNTPQASKSLPGPPSILAVTATATAARGGPAQITVRLSSAADVNATIRNASGRVIAALPSRRLRAGVGLLVWDGKSGRRQATPAGLYWVEVMCRSERGSTARALTVLSRR